ncbi:pseudouridine-5-phosphate glycosidase [Streptomyces alkaliphilus]|uniref:Pseudouridine-5'-phosphate glycosidase n=1 Tax=Streptomyces alkaliphilus TaxID=1472722 RepID=A0A7W3T9Z7_9ACTN|nr:pseudouridine-5'-phosphate glycosidase [Streptomyces alkaliphilus]MBB0242795.1 pseudouridine-5-phosphate glycosidase [Streptomyces alkaliphilus]
MSIHAGPEPYVISEEVADALASGLPVVALESSGVAHGLPQPMNFDTALQMHKAIRGGGAVPARVGIIAGRFVVGMSEEQVADFAGTDDLPKVSVRDIGPALASGRSGGTTVSATLVAAAHAGIRVFAVAGIGGVHFGAPQSFDVSCDLTEFTRHRIVTVCAGAKSLLDPALTLEYLETQGVPVVGYRCDDFPAYYCVSSGHPNPHREDDLERLTAAVRLHWAAGNNGGFMVTHPIAEHDALPSDRIQGLIREKQGEAERAGVTGAAVTPHILAAVSAATRGRTAEANRSVLLSTSALAAEVAVALNRSVPPAGVS